MFSRKKQPPIKSLIAHGTRIEGNVLFEEEFGSTGMWWVISVLRPSNPASW